MDNRLKLKRFIGEIKSFAGIFQKVALSKFRGDVVVLLYNVMDAQNNLLVDHIWSTVKSAGISTGLQIGEQVKFKGYVHTYRKNTGEFSVGIDDIEILI